MVQLTCAKSMQSIYCRHNHVHKINTKLCNIQLISSIHTKNSRGKDRQLWTNSRAFCNHPLAVMVHWSSKAWMENWRGQPQCSSWCFWSKKRLENWRKDIHATVAILIFFYQWRPYSNTSSTYGRHDTWQLWLQSWCLEQWIIERTMMRSIIRKHDK
jgi:hypothetical protein